MKNKIISEDSWLVSMLATTAVAAAVFFYLTPGSVAENIGLVSPVSETQLAQATRPIVNPATERSAGRAFGKFGSFDALPAKEGRGVFEGELVIEVAESLLEDETFIAEYFFGVFDRETGIMVELEPEDTLPPGLQGGDKVRARGLVQNNKLTLRADAAAGEDGSVELIESGGTALDSAGAVTRNVLAILVNTTDKTVGCSLGQVDATLFTGANNVADAFLSASHGSLTIAGNMAGPYNVPYASTDNYYTLSNAAQAQAAADGIDLNAYDHIMHVLPRNTETNYAGFGQLGGKNTWIYRCGMADIYQHELGHNLGLGHANRDGVVYNDRGSFMGYSGIGLRHGHASHMDYLNWLPESSILYNPQPGTYTLSSSDIDPQSTTNPQALVINKPDTNEQYYVSYRTPTGYANNMPAGYDFTTQVHRVGASAHADTDFSFLSPTASFVDEINNVRLTQLTAGGGNTIEIGFNTDEVVPCAPAAPSVGMRPAEISSTPGGTETYTVTVTNNANGSCGSETLSLNTATQDSFLTPTLRQNAVTLSPGAQANLLVDVTSDTGITTGQYSFSVEVVGTTGTNNAEALYTIDTTAPNTPANLSGIVENNEVLLQWTAASDNIGVAEYRVYRDSTRIGTMTKTSFVDSAPNQGSNTYTVTAVDGSGNESAPSAPAVITYEPVSQDTAFQAGDSVQTTQKTNIRPEPGKGRVGSQDAGATGLVGPQTQVNDGTNNWVYVDFTSGADGWIEDSILADTNNTNNPDPEPEPEPEPEPTGNRITVIDTVNVRDPYGLSGKQFGTKEAGDTGTIIDGPVQADGYTWWHIDFDRGRSGWIIESGFIIQ